MFEANKHETGKAVVEHGKHDEHETQVKRKRTRTMGLKKALQKEKEKNPTDEELTFEERISKEINEDNEFWLEKVNTHLENLLYNENKDKNIHKHMVSRY